MARLVLSIAVLVVATAGCSESPVAPTPESVNSLLPPAARRASAASVVPDYSGRWIGDTRMSACDTTNFGVCGRMSSFSSTHIELTFAQAGASITFTYVGRAYTGYITDSQGIFAQWASSEGRSALLLRRVGDGFEGVFALDNLVQGRVVTTSLNQITNLRRVP